MTSYTKDSPLSVSGYNTSYISWVLSMPDSVPNGHYVLGVRIQPANNSNGMIVKNYVIWMLLDVQRSHGRGGGFPYIWLSLLAIPIIGFAVWFFRG
jgi:hypothetical protein